MSKKVTVKLYLEKKVKPIESHTGPLAYPVYVRITVNRRTTQIKSITETFMSEDAFVFYTDTGCINHFETERFKFEYFSFDEERALIQRSVEILLDKDNDYNFSDGNIREHLMYMLKSTRDAFIYTGWNNAPSIADGHISCFIYSFAKEATLIESIKNMNEVLDKDLRNYIPSNVLKMWQVIELVKCIGKCEMPFVCFYDRDYLSELIEASSLPKVREYCLISEKYNLTNQEIESIMSRLIKRYFYFLQ